MGIFELGIEIAVGDAKLLGDKDGIKAKAIGSGRLIGNLACHFPFIDFFDSLFVDIGQGADISGFS